MEEFDWKKFLSRKFLTTWLEMGLIISVPIFYQKLGISNEVQLLVIGMIGVSAGIYKFTNTSEAKSINSQSSKES